MCLLYVICIDLVGLVCRVVSVLSFVLILLKWLLIVERSCLFFGVGEMLCVVFVSSLIWSCFFRFLIVWLSVDWDIFIVVVV